MGRWSSIVLLLFACASAPPSPEPGTSQVYGQVRLVPREGVSPGVPGSAGYGDRRLRDLEFVDYARTGFAVVFVDAAEAPAGELELVIRDSPLGPRVTPEYAAIGAAGRIVVVNESSEAHVLSFPAAGVIRPLGAGESASFAVPRAGEQSLFALDAPAAGTTVFAAPGPFDVVSSTGNFLVNDVAAGSHELRVWHPRFPPAKRDVELAPDTRTQVDFELGVGRGGADHAHH